MYRVLLLAVEFVGRLRVSIGVGVSQSKDGDFFIILCGAVHYFQRLRVSNIGIGFRYTELWVLFLWLVFAVLN